MSVELIGELFSVAVAAYKDDAYLEALQKTQRAYTHMMLTEASARRDKVSALIRALSKLDVEIQIFKLNYERIRNSLSEESIISIEKYLSRIEQKRREVVLEKRALKRRC